VVARETVDGIALGHRERSTIAAASGTLHVRLRPKIAPS
jgi:hypothetical protein